MIFAPGDRVHVAGVGTGVVREVRNASRYLVDIKGRSVLVTGAQLARADQARGRPSPPAVSARAPDEEPAAAPLSLDLHGKTVAEALEAVDLFLNDAIVAGRATVIVIHGRTGGRLKAAVHARLAALPPVRGFALDPRNPGATIVRL